MIDTTVGDRDLRIAITGLDAWLMDVRRLSVRLAVPFSQITGVSVTGPIGSGRRSTHGMSQRTGRLICASRRGEVLRIDADGDPWRTITLSVPDPQGLASKIKSALRASRQ